jgi:hypothetical protein
MSMTMRPLITTYLEMRSPEQLRPKCCPDARFQVREQKKPNWVFNRDLYFRVGEQWEWIDKRSWTDEQWKQYAAAPELRTFAAYYDEVVARAITNCGVTRKAGSILRTLVCYLNLSAAVWVARC